MTEINALSSAARRATSQAKRERQLASEQDGERYLEEAIIALKKDPSRLKELVRRAFDLDLTDAPNIAETLSQFAGQRPRD